jgi:hypothetical protein
MAEAVSVDAAIRKGLLVVNGPVTFLLIVPAITSILIFHRGPVVYTTAGVGFVLAWLWWSLAVPRWRLWAYERVPVAEIPQLKRHAVQVGLTWPDGSLFGRTEIKSAGMVGRQQAFELEAEQTAGNHSQHR